VPGTAQLPAALAMAAVVVGCDVVVHGAVVLAVDRFRRVLRPRVLGAVRRVSGAVLLGAGVRLAVSP
jgi:threonine/homoserine/homoserine lactone efflux protein